jgi:hypothetical protein
VPRRAGTILATAVAGVWLVVAVGLVGGLALEALTLSDERCDVASLEAAQQEAVERLMGVPVRPLGEVEWQMWPPGDVCTYRGARTSEPPAWRTWLIVTEALVGIGLLVVWRASRDAPDPDWTA